MVEPARAAMALGLKDDKAGAQAIGAPVHARVLALSEELARYSNQRTTDNGRRDWPWRRGRTTPSAA